MSTESIQFALNELFASPLPEFYQRHIIFWQDEEREFEAMLDELVLPDVKVVKLTGTNNFAVKKLLIHDDLTSNYLIYNPFSYADQRDNWLRDIELFSKTFHADYISMQMNELNIEQTPAMRKTMKVYSTFFDSKDRVQKLRRIGRSYQTPLQLHIDIMATLAGVPGGSVQDIIIAVLSASLNAEENTILNNIKKFGNMDAFWQLVKKYTGYFHEEGDQLGYFAAHILLTALSQTMNPNILRGLDRFLSESNKAYCYSIVHEWRSQKDSTALFELCRSVEQELKLSSRFDKLEIETLLTGDIFPVINEIILSKLFDEVSRHIVRTDIILKVAENRRTAGWSEYFGNYLDCLYYIGKMQEFYQANAAGFHLVDPKAVWKLYTDTGYQMDSFYRHFHHAYQNTLADSNAALDDSLKHAVGYVEGLYQNWFLNDLTQCWTTAISDDLTTLGYVSEIKKQRDFYRSNVKPLEGKASRAFVIISDALRYEVAAELCDKVTREMKGTAKLDSMQAIFPSITKFGMTALLPGRSITVNERLEVLMDNQPTRSTKERETVLASTNSKSVAIQYVDLLNMKQDERRKAISGQEVVYIYHNTIDAIGDKAPTENKVFDACEDAIRDLTNIIKIIVNTMNGTDIFITADHGFLYTYSPLSEADKVSKSTFSGTIYEVGRRYALTEAEASSEFLLPVNVSGEIDATGLRGFTPLDSTRLKIAGGGENYVHGGISLQEMVVPLLTYKHIRTTSKKYVETTNAELKLLSESRKVSNLLFSLDFFQRQPVGDKVQPCAYSIYMTDEDGAVISDRQTVIADRTSANASERVYRVRLNLKAGAYNSKKIYRLVIANDTDVPEEIEFRIDIAFADDFGFDL